MSMVSELMREAPAYKKAVLAVAVTAGVGACVYLGYRQLSGPQTSKNKPRGPSKSEEKSASHAKVREPSPAKEEHVVLKPEPKKIDPPKTGTFDKPKTDTFDKPKTDTFDKPKTDTFDKPKTDTFDKPKTDTFDRSVLTGKQNVHKTASPLKVEELSTSVTFEKISLGAESDNFEHVTMSQINPLGSSPKHGVEKKEQAGEQVVSSGSFTQLQGEASSDSSLLKDTYENLSMSQADPSISFISAAEEEQKEKAASKSKAKQTELKLPEIRQAVVPKIEEAGGSSNDEELATAASGVSVKDENDIVVVETNVGESGLEKSEEPRVSPRSGMASVDIDFDSSRVSPVFGQQTYHRVDTEPEELATFDPSKSHPASFGFKFDGSI